MVRNEETVLKRKLNNEVLSNRYRQRVAKFVIEMAKEPAGKFDEYNVNWKRKNAYNVIPELDKKIRNIDHRSSHELVNKAVINRNSRNKIVKSLQQQATPEEDADNRSPLKVRDPYNPS